jgi:outer membrane protein TolC
MRYPRLPNPLFVYIVTQRLLRVLLAGLVFGGVASPGAAGEPPPDTDPVIESTWHECDHPVVAGDSEIQGPGGLPAHPVAPSKMTLSLAECLDLAAQRQPRIAAQQAWLAAAEDGYRALLTLGPLASLDKELPIRRKQAALGVRAASAGLSEAERSTVYAVTRGYLTVQYARQQERLADRVVEHLTTIRKTAQDMLSSGARDVTAVDVNRSSVYVHLAKTRQIEASHGVKRALASLKEAIGLEPEACLDLLPGHLNPPEPNLCEGDVVAWALERRGGLIQAAVFAEVACLEVKAQGLSCRNRMQTFAAGSDIHSHPIPPEIRNAEYRPGGIPPGMPTFLAGTRAERMKHAQDLYQRGQAVVEATRNLIVLEAEDTFVRWQQALRQAREARQAADDADKVADSLTRDFTTGLKVKVEDVVNARVLASQARSQYNQYRHREALALVELERVTAGGFSAGLVDPGKAQVLPAPHEDSGDR